MTGDISSAPASRACSLFSELIECHWEQAREQFDAGLRGRMDTELLARAWGHMGNRGGMLERMGDAATRQSGTQTVVDVPLVFHGGQGIGRVVLDADGKVTGLRWEHPRRHRIDPRRIGAFVIGNGTAEVREALRLPF